MDHETAINGALSSGKSQPRALKVPYSSTEPAFGGTAVERQSRLMIDAKACSSWDWLRLIEVSVTTYPFFKVLIFKMLTVGPLLLLLLLTVIGGGLICQ